MGHHAPHWGESVIPGVTDSRARVAGLTIPTLISVLFLGAFVDEYLIEVCEEAVEKIFASAGAMGKV